MVKSHTGKTCPYCQFPIKQDSEAVQCPACKVPHHRECWEQNGGCTTFGCREKTYLETAEEQLDISFDEAPGWETAPSRGGSNYKLLAAALVTTLGLLIVVFFAYINLLTERSVVVERVSVPGADYYIDYENGSIPLGDLPIGTRVVDLSWEWEYRTGKNYSRIMGDVTKPVIWIIVAKGHYNLDESHVTLLTDELIGLFPFDDSTDRVSVWGHNNWEFSGTTNASNGLRPWLNSNGIHEGEGFYNAFSTDFKHSVITTPLFNKEWEGDNAYTTPDDVFVPSTTELGDEEHKRAHQIGTAYHYFIAGNNNFRSAKLGDDTRWYWTRTPDSEGGDLMRLVYTAGSFGHGFASGRIGYGVRPALNLRSETTVSEFRN